MTATEAELFNGAVLRSNSNAKDGEDIDYIRSSTGSYGLWTFTMDESVDNIKFRVKAATSGTRYLSIDIDGVAIVNNLAIDSGSFNVGAEYTITNSLSLSAGEHTIKVYSEKDSYGPIADYVLLKYKEV
jgi:hypothetical protein